MSTVGGIQETPARTQSAAAPAAVGSRVGAIVIDTLLFIVVFFVLGAVTGGGHSGHGHASMHLNGTTTLVYFLIWFAYFTICEGATGQTLGKKLSRIRVARLDGSKASLGQAAARNILRVVDALPVFYIVGLISVAATGERRRQRVGDIAARTVVVDS